jgi:hypothetical protein
MFLLYLPLLSLLFIDGGLQSFSSQLVSGGGHVDRVLPPNLLFVQIFAPPLGPGDKLSQLHDRGPLDVAHPDIVADYAPDLRQFLLHPLPVVSVLHVGAVSFRETARVISVSAARR